MLVFQKTRAINVIYEKLQKKYSLMKNPLKTAMNYMLCLVISGISCSPSLASGQTINTKKDSEMPEIFDKIERKMSDEEVERRAKEFEPAIRDYWRDSSKKDGLNPRLRINNIVEKYISTGMSFSDAEKILRAGGFSYRLATNYDGTQFVSCSLDISPKQFLIVFQKIEVLFSIKPIIYNDFNSGVGKAGGFIDYTSL